MKQEYHDVLWLLIKLKFGGTLWFFIPSSLSFKVTTPSPYNYTWCAGVSTTEVQCTPCYSGSNPDLSGCYDSAVSVITVLDSEPELACEEDLPYWRDTPAGKMAVSNCPSGYKGDN